MNPAVFLFVNQLLGCFGCQALTWRLLLLLLLLLLLQDGDQGRGGKPASSSEASAGGAGRGGAITRGREEERGGEQERGGEKEVRGGEEERGGAVWRQGYIWGGYPLQSPVAGGGGAARGDRGGGCAEPLHSGNMRGGAGRTPCLQQESLEIAQ